MKKINCFKYCLFSFAVVASSAVFAQKGVDQINTNGQLVMAARTGQVDRASALLAEGAKVNSRDRNGDTPLNMAANKGNLALVEVLLKAGADVNLGNLAGVTPLMSSAFSVKPEVLRLLLAAGATPNTFDRVKKNAATYAAGTGCTDCLVQLLDAGVAVNAKMENNLTLLMWAAAYGHESAVSLLLAKGAERSLQDGRGKTAADMAREENHLAVVQLLK
jgi:hypothetical protein